MFPLANLAINFVSPWLWISWSILFPLDCEPRNQFLFSHWSRTSWSIFLQIDEQRLRTSQLILFAITINSVSRWLRFEYTNLAVKVCLPLITNLAINSCFPLVAKQCEPRTQFCGSSWFAFSSGYSGTQLRWPTHSEFPRGGRTASFHSYGVHLGGVFYQILWQTLPIFFNGRFHTESTHLCF